MPAYKNVLNGNPFALLSNDKKQKKRKTNSSPSDDDEEVSLKDLTRKYNDLCDKLDDMHQKYRDLERYALTIKYERDEFYDRLYPQTSELSTKEEATSSAGKADAQQTQTAIELNTISTHGDTNINDIEMNENSLLNSSTFPSLNEKTDVKETTTTESIEKEKTTTYVVKETENGSINNKTTFQAATENKTHKNENKLTPPPIFCRNLSTAAMYRHFKGQLKPAKYSVNNVNVTKTIIRPVTKEDHTKIIQYLKEVNVEHHTFTPKDERKKVLLLKHIHRSFTPDEVQEELKAYNISALKVSPFKSRTNKQREFNAFLVEFSPSTSLEEVTVRKSLFGEVIQWERLKSNDVTQCKRCQQAGHVQANCQNKRRCVKCDEEHEIGECKRKNREDGKPYCVLCKSEGHPANYRGCPAMQQLIERRRAKSASVKQQAAANQAAVAAAIVPGKSFADLLKPKPKPIQKPPKPKPTTPTVPKPKSSIQDRLTYRPPITQSTFLADSQEFFGCDFLGLLGKINSFLPSYEACPNTSEKKSLYLKFCFQLCLGSN